MRLTYHGANSWLLEFGQQRILIDPWLVGSLVFGNLNWFFKGDRPYAVTIPENIDLILLSQGLDDHAHRPTLQHLDKSIPVVGSPSAAKVVQALGYTQVTSLAPGQVYTQDLVEVRALPGAPIGLQLENSFLIKQLETGKTLYYEPHGYPPQELKDYTPVDVVISPIVNLELPLVGPIVQGDKTALALAQLAKPQVFLPTTAGGEVTYEGVLNSLIQQVGGVEAFRANLEREGLTTQVVDPVPNQPIELSLVADPLSL